MNPALSKESSATLCKKNDGAFIRVTAILMVIQRPPTAKGTCFITLEDEFGSIDVILHSKTFEKYRDVILQSRILQISGRVQVSGAAHTIIVNEVIVPKTTRAIKARNVYHGMHPRDLKLF